MGKPDRLLAFKVNDQIPSILGYPVVKFLHFLAILEIVYYSAFTGSANNDTRRGRTCAPRFRTYRFIRPVSLGRMYRLCHNLITRKFLRIISHLALISGIKTSTLCANSLKNR